MPEEPEEMLSRVREMAADRRGLTWDLSTNDRAALKHLLKLVDEVDHHLVDEVQRLRGAIRAAGFEVCQTSGDWSLHDVSELGKAEEARSLEVATMNVELTVENARLRQEILELEADKLRLRALLAKSWSVA